MRTVITSLVAAAVALPAGRAAADALCCVNPNLPIGREEAAVPLEPGALRLRLGAGYTRHATAREGARALHLEDDGHDHHHHHHDDHGARPVSGVVMDLALATGLGRGLSAQITAPFVYIAGEMGSLAGVGDPVASVAWSGSFGDLDLRLAAGTSVPVGTVGAEAAVEDTTGATVATGTVDPVFAVEFARPLGQVSVHAGVDGRTPLYATARGDRSGAQLGGRIGLGLPVTDVLGAGLDLQYRYRDRDTFEGAVYEDSGGHWVYAVPAVHWAFAPTWAVEARAFVPLFQYVNGTQLGHDFAISVGLSGRLGPFARKRPGGGDGAAARPLGDGEAAAPEVTSTGGGEATSPEATTTGDGEAAAPKRATAPSITDRRVRRLVLRGEALPPLSASVPTVYDFFAEWCAPCHELAERLEVLAEARPDAFVLRKVDVTRWDDRALQALVGEGGVLPYVRIVAPDGTLRVADSGTVDQLLRRVERALDTD